MDPSSLTGDNTNASHQKQNPESDFAYTAQVISSLLNGEAKMKIDEASLTVTMLFDAVEIPYVNMLAFVFTDYSITVETREENYTFSRMGQWAQPFFDALRSAYNKAVLRSLFIKGEPLLTAKGNYQYNENNTIINGTAPIYLYENCVVTLPPNSSARRVPFCFVDSMDNGDYKLTLKLNTGESYSYAKLGYNTDFFTNTVKKQIRKLHEKSLATVKELAPSLTLAAASRIARFMLEGTAVPIGRLAAIAPSFVTSLEEKLSATRAADSYKVFKEQCNPTQIYIGFRKNESEKNSYHLTDTLNNILTFGNNPEKIEKETTAPDQYLLWLIAPSPDGQFAAMEFAVADTATFIYRTDGNFDRFAQQLSRALEAIDFKREVIRLSNEELYKPENADYYMASERTIALQFVRSRFVGRVIHSNFETWKHKLTELWSSTLTSQPPVTSVTQVNPKFCTACGAALSTGVRFCGNCGTKIKETT